MSADNFVKLGKWNKEERKYVADGMEIDRIEGIHSTYKRRKRRKTCPKKINKKGGKKHKKELKEKGN